MNMTDIGVPTRMKSATRYPPGPMIRALTWWVGSMNALDVESATINAYMVGLAPVASAMLTAMALAHRLGSQILPERL